MAKRIGIFGNLETKVMALIMAIVLYVYAMSEHSGQASNVNVPLYITLPPATIILEKYPDRVNVSFVGPQKAIEKLNEVRSLLEIRCTVDEKGHENDDGWTTTITLNPDQIIGVPHEVTVTKIEPDNFTLTIARTTTKELKVRLHLTGEPPPGLELSKTTPPEVFPGTITVTGPKRVLARATEISTKPISLSTFPPIAGERIRGTEKLEKSVEVKVDNQIKREPIDCNQEVTYWVTFTQVKETRVLKKVPVYVLRIPTFPYVARPIPGQETIDIELRGTKQYLDKLNVHNVFPYVFLGDQRPSKSNIPVTLPVRVILPDEVQGKVEVINEPPKVVGIDILEMPMKKEGGPTNPF